MINVIGEDDCGSAEVESDQWIPLKVSWWPRRQVRPLYLRVTGTNGGEIELKVDPDTGALLQLIVIDEPPAAAAAGSRDPAWPDDALVKRTPTLDRSVWGGCDKGGAATETRPLFVVHDLMFERRAETAVLRFSKSPVAEYIRCDDVAVGVSAERMLVTVEARLPS